jgi:hypothetical protein
VKISRIKRIMRESAVGSRPNPSGERIKTTGKRHQPK